VLKIITSIISCGRYLNIIQINNFYHNSYSNSKSSYSINPTISYIISILTIFKCLIILKPINIISKLAYKL